MSILRNIAILVALLVASVATQGQSPSSSSGDYRLELQPVDEKISLLPEDTDFEDEESDQKWHLDSLSEDGVIEYDYNTGIATGEGGVIVTFEDATVTADRIILNDRTGEVNAVGNVLMRRHGSTWSGELVQYNYKTKELNSGLFKAGSAPVFVAGAGLSYSDEANIYQMEQSSIATEDIENPLVRIRAKSIEMVPEKYVIARKATLMVGEVPVMYLPYYRKRLTQHRFFYVPEPGYRSLDGVYLLNQFHYAITPELNSVTHLDYRWKRGFAGGQDFEYQSSRYGVGHLQTYLTRDQDPHQYDREHWLPNNRDWLYFDYDVQLRPHMEIKTAIRHQSDPYVLRDFAEDIYEDNQQPSSFVEFNYDWRNFNLNVLAQPRVNNFFETVERLPDIKFDAYRQQIGISPFYYESQSQAGFFTRRYSRRDSICPNYEALRGDTYHQITLPVASFGWLNVTPRAGVRGTYYGSTTADYETRVVRTSEVGRFVFNTGMETSFKLSRTWKNAENKFLGVDGLRHVIEPNFNYIFVPEPSRDSTELPQYDYFTDNYRLPTLNYPDYTTIDSVDSENVMRLGLRNRFQTERNNSLVNLINWAIYTDWRLDRNKSELSDFSDFYTSLTFSPRDWLDLTTETRLSTDNGDLKENSNYITLKPSDRWSFSFGYRYMEERPIYYADSEDPYLMSDNLFMGRFTVRLNENYAFRTHLQYDADKAKLERQEYSIYRDMRSWVAAFRFSIKDSKSGPTDVSVSLGCQIKLSAPAELGSDEDKFEQRNTMN